MIVGIDTETKLIGPDQVNPDLICLTFNSGILSGLHSHCDPELEDFLLKLLQSETILVAANVAFDMTVIAKAFPALLPEIFAKYNRDQITDIGIREKLLNLGTHGKLTHYSLPSGAIMKITYHLAVLARNYLGKDRFESKLANDSWRLRFEELEGMRSDEYPDEARQYALEDAEDHRAIYLAQEDREESEDLLATEFFQARADFALRLMTIRGIKIDQAARLEILKAVEGELSEEKMAPLYESGILRRPVEPRAYKSDPSKFTKGKPASVNRKELQALISDICASHEFELELTEGGAVSCNKAILHKLSPYSDVLARYKDRQHVQKLITTELPRIDAEYVHPDFDVLKETGRTSSYAASLYPSCNIQNVDPRVRRCYVPREGYCLVSWDYSFLELCAHASVSLDLFGNSVLADVINSGRDPHAYLGSKLALRFNKDFQEACAGVSVEPDIFFQSMGNSDQPSVRDFYDHWRTFGKITGLAVPGGLGARTMSAYARNTFKVDISEANAELFRNATLDTYPEIQAGFNWVDEQSDFDNSGLGDQRFKYVSPLGMHRRGSTWSATANGKFLQTPSAEGFKQTLWDVVSACTIGQIEGVYPLAPIHDEILAEVKLDEHLHDRAYAVRDVMVDSMGTVIKGVKISVDPVAMMHWDKKAKTVFDREGRLSVFS